MNKKTRDKRKEIKKRKDICRIWRRWDKYGCSCGKHNMRGDK